MKRKDYLAYWKPGDISPINEAQKEEVEKIKSDFIRELKNMEFKRGDRITIDPYFRHIRLGEGDYLPVKESKVIFKWGFWEFYHIKNWVRSYINSVGFHEVYHFYARSPIGAIEFEKQ